MIAAAVLVIGASPAYDPDSAAFAQGNSISGFVWGLERRPLADVNVELQDDMFATLQRTRTNHSGVYQFYNVPGGRLRVKVLPYGTDYEPQEKEIEIINFTRDNGAGGLRRSGFSNEKHDFYLNLRRDAVASTTGTIFAQEIPADAKRLYDQAVEDLANKKEKEGLEGLKSALEIFPKYFYALDRLGNEYVRLRHFEAAEILLAIAVDVNPKGFRSWYGLAYARYSQKKYASALEATEKATVLNPTSPENLFLTGSLLRLTKKYDNAEKALLQAQKESGDRLPLVHWELALLYANNLNRPKDAANELKAFLKAQPDTKDAEMIKKLIVDLEAKAKA